MPPDTRAGSFTEVVGGVKPQWAAAEARRCLQCNDAPCVSGCPAGVDIPKFIRAIRTQNFRSSIKTIREANVLAGVCARVCPVEQQCEGSCASSKLKEPIAIAALQRFVSDEDLRRGGKPDAVPAATLGPVAVVGSGPAGLACAAELARLGVAATVIEASDAPGGLLRHGIPEYRLPRDILDREIAFISAMGVGFVTGRAVSSFAALLAEGFKAVFIAVGLASVPRLGVPGEDMDGVHSWSTFLRAGSQAPARGRTIVVGGGNSALDAAGVAVRRRASEVLVLYRRTPKEMPAFPEEVRMAAEEGVKFRFLAAPVAVLGNGRVEELRCIEMKLGEPDASGRARPEPVSGSEFTLPCETVVAALGQKLSGVVREANPELAVDARGALSVDAATYTTSVPGVFAAGDAVNGGTTVVRAVAEGRDAARAIQVYLIDVGRGLLPAPR